MTTPNPTETEGLIAELQTAADDADNCGRPDYANILTRAADALTRLEAIERRMGEALRKIYSLRHEDWPQSFGDMVEAMYEVARAALEEQ